MTGGQAALVAAVLGMSVVAGGVIYTLNRDTSLPRTLWALWHETWLRRGDYTRVPVGVDPLAAQEALSAAEQWEEWGPLVNRGRIFVVGNVMRVRVKDCEHSFVVLLRIEAKPQRRSPRPSFHRISMRWVPTVSSLISRR